LLEYRHLTNRMVAHARDEEVPTHRLLCPGSDAGARRSASARRHRVGRDRCRPGRPGGRCPWRRPRRGWSWQGGEVGVPVQVKQPVASWRCAQATTPRLIVQSPPERQAAHRRRASRCRRRPRSGRPARPWPGSAPRRHLVGDEDLVKRVTPTFDRHPRGGRFPWPPTAAHFPDVAVSTSSMALTAHTKTERQRCQHR
jgi:hypothetical protein